VIVLRGILAVVVGLLTFPVYIAFAGCVILALPFVLLAAFGSHVVHGVTGVWLIDPKCFENLLPNRD
jgi:hypothetical protein